MRHRSIDGSAVSGGGPDVVVVTGATSGIGRAITSEYCEAGARVVAMGRRIERLGELRRAFPRTLHAAPVDVRDAVAVQRTISSLPAAYQHVSILVNNAGLAKGLERAPTASLDDWTTMVDTNIKGMLHCTSAILPGMVERDRGYIINIGSVAADTPYAGGNVYGATKAFTRQFTLNLRADLLGTSIRATCIEPGMVRTEFLSVRFGGDEERANQLYGDVDYLVPEDIAHLVSMLTSLEGRVNVNLLQVMPVQQAHAGYAFAGRASLRPRD